VIRGVISGGDR